MNNVKRWMLLCALILTVGCSKKAEECPVVEKPLMDKKDAITSVSIASAKDKDAAAFSLDAEIAKNAAAAAEQLIKELTAAKLTDEPLVAQNTEVVAKLTAVKDFLLTWSDSAASAAKSKKQDDELGKLLDGSKAAISSYCKEKLRKRKDKTKRRKVCKPVLPLINDLSLAGLDEATLPQKRSALEGLSLSDESLKTPVSEIIDTLGKTENALKTKKDIENKYKAYALQFTSKKADLDKAAEALKTYCAAK